MIQAELNLARKLRVRQFDHIVGQTLVVRMLKNSLYVGHYFPVYLFVGQHGSGKTSTARIFAAAVNCARLTDFRTSPRTQALPCLACTSCVTLAAGGHPDFIEIDAASYTGVDNVRQIIESASFLPTLGEKKIYLIDEAHMLSKAAFNALLKILEEPPRNVLFMLATTDAEKILETVRSRCFQLFFNSVESSLIERYLADICKQEKIEIDAAALALISVHARGSVRDALNTLERVRFAYTNIKVDQVRTVLGQIDDTHIIMLLQLVWYATPTQLLEYIKEYTIYQANVIDIWRRLQDILRIAVWLKYDVALPQSLVTQELKDLVQRVSILQVHELMDILYQYEPLFLKTNAPALLLETLLIQAMQKKKLVAAHDTHDADESLIEQAVQDEIVVKERVSTVVDQSPHKSDAQNMWLMFLSRIKQETDPLLESIFKQADAQVVQEDRLMVMLSFQEQHIFYQDLLNNSVSVWQPLLHAIFGSDVQWRIVFRANVETPVLPNQVSQSQVPPKAKEVVPVMQPSVKQAPPKQTSAPAATGRYDNKYDNKKRFAATKEKITVLDVSDVQKWPLINKLLHHFPGVVAYMQ